MQLPIDYSDNHTDIIPKGNPNKSEGILRGRAA